MVYERLLKHRPGFFVLLDPDRIPRTKGAYTKGARTKGTYTGGAGAKSTRTFGANTKGAYTKCDYTQIADITKTVCDSNLTAILVGTSLLYSVDFNDFLKVVKDNSTVPVIIFPGGARQLSPHADALFFLSLVSGRNPELLIGEHVRAAPLIKHYGLEVIPVGYILIESGSMTSVEFMSDTKPIPRDKPEIVAAHALASEYLGMKLIYLEAGSGGSTMVGEGIISQVRKATILPLIVGGGIRTPRDADKRLKAGADFFVIGNALEADYRKVKGFSRIFEK